MTYDFHGGWENQTGHNSPFLGRDANDALNMVTAMQAYRDAGVPGEKLVVGLAFYGRGWGGVGSTNNGLYQPSGGEAQGPYEPGLFEYEYILQQLTSQPAVWQNYWDDVSKVPYVYAPNLNGGTWIGYDNPESIRNKVEWAKEQGLGGVMFWELSGDTPSGSGNSLLDTIYDELIEP